MQMNPQSQEPRLKLQINMAGKIIEAVIDL